MTSTAATMEREFVMSDADFKRISNIAYKYTGIVLGDHKKNMVYGRLARRLRQLGLSEFGDYCRLIEDKNQEEANNFINSITTNLTSFYREMHHFDFLKGTVLPELMTKNRADRRLRLWSAGCSTGEEPYSIAMSILDSISLNGWDCKILATDLDSKVLDTGRAGIYERNSIDEASPESTKKWFFLDRNHPEIVKVKPALRELISFKRLNLLEKWPMSGPFDVIFCRNVVIYFDEETQRKLFNHYADILAPDGYLFIGHSESLQRVCDRFEPCGRTVYRKIR